MRIPGAAEALGLSGDADDYLILRDQRSGLDYLRGVRDLREHGLELSLDGYGCHVFLGFEEVSDAGAAGWGELAMRIGLGGVPDAHRALRRLREEPLRAAVAAVFATRLARDAFLPLPDTPPAATRLAAAVASDRCRVAGGARAGRRGRRHRWAARRAWSPDRQGWHDASAGCVPASWPRPWPARSWPPPSGRSPAATTASAPSSAFDDWEMAAAIDEGARGSGSSDAQAWRCVELARALLALPPGALAAAAATPGLPEAWFALPAVRAASGWNEWQGARYLSQEAWSELLEALGARDGLLAEDGLPRARLAAGTRLLPGTRPMPLRRSPSSGVARPRQATALAAPARARPAPSPA